MRSEPKQPRYRDVLQVEVLVVHRLAELADPFLHFAHLFGRELAVCCFVLLQLQQADHQLQTGPVQVHVQTVATQDVHQGRRA